MFILIFFFSCSSWGLSMFWMNFIDWWPHSSDPSARLPVWTQLAAPPESGCSRCPRSFAVGWGPATSSCATVAYIGTWLPPCCIFACIFTCIFACIFTTPCYIWTFLFITLALWNYSWKHLKGLDIFGIRLQRFVNSCRVISGFSSIFSDCLFIHNECNPTFISLWPRSLTSFIYLKRYTLGTKLCICFMHSRNLLWRSWWLEYFLEKRFFYLFFCGLNPCYSVVVS